MGKKKKNPETITSTNNASSTVFDTLFGNLPDNQTSIFSDQNPFKRIPNEQNHKEKAGSNPESPISAENKRKKNKKNPETSSDYETVAKKIKKSKKGSLSDQLEGIEVGTEKKREKKRKREEVEAEYEANKYGAVVEGGKSVVGEKRKKADEEMVVVEREGFDDEAKMLRTVFVGNLPVKIKKKALFAEFRQFGDVESVRIRSVPLLDTKIPRKGAIIQKKINDAVDSVHAYVVFKIEESSQAALTHNMAVVGGKHIRVDRACPPRKKLKGEDSAPLYDNKRTVFLGNLPFDVKDEEVYQVISGIKDLDSSSIEGIRVVRDPGSSLGKGIAYVLFKTRVDANLVVRKHGLKLRDRELRVSHAKSNVTPSKRKDSPSGERNDSGSKKLALNSESNNSKYKFDTSLSYQGLRATKSGVEKKTSLLKRNEPVKFKSMPQSGPKKKERSTKRPTVAARKAKANKSADGSGSKNAGFKRKMDNRTPSSTRGRPNKKAKKF